MLDFITTVLLFGVPLLLGIGIYKAIAQVAEHVRQHPEAGKALYEHLFLPLFSNKPTSPDNNNNRPSSPSE